MAVRRSEEEDFLLRMIRQVTQMIARMRELLASGTVSGETVRAEVQSAVAELLGRDAPILSQMDAESAARLIGKSEIVERWAELVELEADSRMAEGDGSLDTSLRRRAAAIRAAAEGMKINPTT